MTLKDFNETFAEELRDPEFARTYLSAALEDGDLDVFLIALRDVIGAVNVSEEGTPE
jgi:DNA-binding phage protein